jgi:glycosyltransferase involved in cell wall biosynthesis
MDGFISVIMPAYNCEKYIIDAIESVLAQTYKNFEIIVIDDGSTDNTREVLRKYIENGTIRYTYQKNAGVSTARNTGIRQAEGDLIAFLDSDDLWLNHKLQVQSDLFKKYPAVDCLGGDLIGIDESYEYSDTEEMKIDKIEYETMIIQNKLRTSTVMVKKEILPKSGLFDEGLTYAEDRDLWLRISKAGSCYKIRLPLTRRRDRREAGLSFNTKAMVTCTKIILRKNFIGMKFGLKKVHLFFKAYGYFYSDLSWTEFMNKRRSRAIGYLMLSFLIYTYTFSKDMVKTSMHRLKELYRYIFNKRPILD